MNTLILRAGALAALTLLSLPVLADSAGTLSTDFFKYSERGGPAIYAAICAGCHQPAGQGAEGAGRYPALAGNPAVGASDYVLHNVLHGRHGMPGFAKGLDDEQVADVVNYVRSSFGNHFSGQVTPEQVHAAR